MAVRTTAELVGGIIEVDEDIDLDPFILTANLLVTEICAPVETYDSERLELIERWLAAHFYCTRDRRAVTEQASSVMSRYESETSLYLANSQYGQQAMLLDTAGGLAKLNEEMKEGGKKTVGVTWLGTELDEEDEEEL